MAGVNTLLSIARTAMTASQQAAEVAGNNVANANTAGYSRERVELAPRSSTYLPPAGWFGNGVQVVNVTRARDVVLDQTYRQSAADGAASTALRDGRMRIESILGEPSDTGLAASIDAFWNSWNDLAATPLSSTARSVVQQRGARVAGMLNQFSAQLRQLTTDTQARADALVSEANNLAASIASLNARVVAGQSSGQAPNEAMDQRDQLVDRLTSIVGGTAEPQSDGAVTVRIGGVTFVDGTSAKTIVGKGAGSTQTLAFSSDPLRPLPIGGSLGASLQVITQEVPDTVQGLDELARGIVQAVNGAHANGVLWSGTPPVATPAPEFFATDPTAASPEADALQTAGGIRLSAAVAANADNIAASDATSGGPSDNRVAAAIAGLRTGPVSFTDPTGATTSTESIASHYRRLASTVSLGVTSASSDANTQDVLTKQADARRQSVSGVATDEELVNLMKSQQSYAAAARLMTVADEMSQRLIDLGTR